MDRQQQRHPAGLLLRSGARSRYRPIPAAAARHVGRVNFGPTLRRSNILVHLHWTTWTSKVGLISATQDNKKTLITPRIFRTRSRKVTSCCTSVWQFAFSFIHSFTSFRQRDPQNTNIYTTNKHTHTTAPNKLTERKLHKLQTTQTTYQQEISRSLKYATNTLEQFWHERAIYMHYCVDE